MPFSSSATVCFLLLAVVPVAGRSPLVRRASAKLSLGRASLGETAAEIAAQDALEDKSAIRRTVSWQGSVYERNAEEPAAEEPAAEEPAAEEPATTAAPESIMEATSTPELPSSTPAAQPVDAAETKKKNFVTKLKDWWRGSKKKLSPKKAEAHANENKEEEVALEKAEGSPEEEEATSTPDLPSSTPAAQPVDAAEASTTVALTQDGEAESASSTSTEAPDGLGSLETKLQGLRDGIDKSLQPAASEAEKKSAEYLSSLEKLRNNISEFKDGVGQFEQATAKQHKSIVRRVKAAVDGDQSQTVEPHEQSRQQPQEQPQEAPPQQPDDQQHDKQDQQQEAPPQ